MSRFPAKRCAIYTRKSSDEGLDQAFNSLDAQREAGEAYVTSQAGEGWCSVPVRYDDGGFSGGSMERPGLQRLLANVEAGLIDVVVVYKIDRLTRSLADFARIVERFDAKGVSFVSVTQAFNTTSSMGRLTLNVLLSFAQFEREVTGERIRDKIAASKAKGMWMGGVLPLGYDLPAAGTRTLQVNEAEAATVRHIYCRYLELGSVHRLAEELAGAGIVSRRRTTRTGQPAGGNPFSRGALFHLLRSPIYLGKIPHKGAVHEGAHSAIIDQGLFDAVQARLHGQQRRHAYKGERRVEKAPLTGRLFDAAGEPMSPTHSRGKSGRIYRYYVSAPLQQGAGPGSSNGELRISAPALEMLLHETLAAVLASAADPLGKVRRITVQATRIDLHLPSALARVAASYLRDGLELTRLDRATSILTIRIALPLRGGRCLVEPGQSTTREPDRALVAALRKAHAMVSQDGAGLPLIATAPASPYDRRIIKLALLASHMQRDIVTGRQPNHINLEYLTRREIPASWADQQRIFGWPG